MAEESQWSKARFEAFFEPYGGGGLSEAQAKKRMRLIKAATELITKQGYRKTSVDEIARRAGVAKGTVYNFFPTKAALVIEAVAVEKKVMMKILDPILSGTLAPEKRLAFYVRVFVTAGHQLPLTSLLVLHQEDFAEVHDTLGTVMTAELREVGASMFMELIELAAPGKLSEPVKRARAHVLQGLHQVTVRIADPRTRGPLAVEEFGRRLADMILAGLLADHHEVET